MKSKPTLEIEKKEGTYDFKLIAIRPLVNCNLQFRKVLSENQSYVFYKNYDFSNYSSKKRIIKVDIDQKPDFYSITNSKKDKIKINISALVGMNGAGKSSLVELFYAFCYNISVLNNVLIDENTNQRVSKKDLIPKINLEIFYQLGDDLNMIYLRGDQYDCYRMTDGYMTKLVKKEILLSHFFYTISINYSLHALNSRVLGEWLRLVFDKNDGYQTPIVLNPYRKLGNIDINNEEYLVKSRLISNVLGRVSKSVNVSDSLRNILDNKIAYRLHVNLRKEKFKYDKDGKPIFELTEKYGAMVLPELFEQFFKNREFVPKDTLLNRYAIEYILYKLQRIANKYEPYKLFKSFFTDEKQTTGYMQMLSKERSHVTFKLQQALNFLVNPLYYDRSEHFDLTVAYLSRRLLGDKRLENFELIDILPPSFFDVDIEFKDNGRFSELSSGEKQRVYSMTTLIYHLNNLNSTNAVTAMYKYEYVNVVFDELELYFHPDLQRTLVHDLLSNIRKINLQFIYAINILFITHSPFILSDITIDNILVLDKTGIPITHRLDQTFGANIFDLLKENFFLENGPMGEQAKFIINNTIEWLNNEKRDLRQSSYHREVIDLIGEPILRFKLLEMYNEMIGSKTKAEILQEQINKLQEELNQLK